MTTELTIQLRAILPEAEAQRVMLDALRLYEQALRAALYERGEWWAAELKMTRQLIAALERGEHDDR